MTFISGTRCGFSFIFSRNISRKENHSLTFSPVIYQFWLYTAKFLKKNILSKGFPDT